MPIELLFLSQNISKIHFYNEVNLSILKLLKLFLIKSDADLYLTILTKALSFIIIILL